MRIADKAELHNSLVKRMTSCVAEHFPSWSSYVDEGGGGGEHCRKHYHGLNRKHNAELCQMYIQYVRTHYRIMFMVFDGYENGSSTKDDAHISFDRYATLKGYSDVISLPNEQYTEIDPAVHQDMGLIFVYLPGSVSVLNFERAARLNQKVVTKSSHIPPERLPPTSDTARFTVAVYTTESRPG